MNFESDAFELAALEKFDERRDFRWRGHCFCRHRHHLRRRCLRRYTLELLYKINEVVPFIDVVLSGM